MTIAVLLRLASHEQLCGLRMCLQIRHLIVVADFGVILVFNESYRRVICIAYGTGLPH